MKKFICLILMLVMLPIASLTLAGCKDKDYNLTQFSKTYQDIANKTDYLVLVDANNPFQLDVNSKKIDINYSKSTRLSTLVGLEGSQYSFIKNLYQQLLDDTLSPVYFFGDAISASKKVSKKQTKQLFVKLEALEQEYLDLDYSLKNLVNSLEGTNDATSNLSFLKKVYIQYEQAINCAGELSSVVCSIYFDTILTNSTFDYSYTTHENLTEGDLSSISIDTRARMYYFKSIYANIYNQTCIRNGEIPDKIVGSITFEAPTYAPYNYLANIKSLNSKPYSNLINDKNSVKQIYNNCIALYNLQNAFEDAYATFNLATSKVAYLDLNTKSTADEINYGKIISNFTNGIAYDSYEIVQNLVNLLYL